MPSMLALLTLCLSLSILYVSADNTSQLVAYPTRWELPSHLEWSAQLSPPVEANKISVRFRIENNNPDGPILKFVIEEPLGGSPICHIEVDSDNHKELKSDLTVGFDNTELCPHVELDNVLLITNIRLICPRAMLQRPAGSTNPVWIKAIVEINYQKGQGSEPQNIQFPQSTFEIINAPTFLHRYVWIASQPSMVSVTFTFYRPTTMADQFVFGFIHPLLDFSTITSLHSSDGNTVNDLKRLYNLLEYISTGNTHPPLKCKHNDAPMSSEIIFTPTLYGTDYVVSTKVNVPTNAPIQDYRCTFTLDYPADVLYSILHEPNPVDNPKLIEISTAGSPPTEVEMFIPHELYAQVTIEDTSPRGVYLWHSSHHSHDLFHTFEFGIAMTDRSFPRSDIRGSIEPIDPDRQPNVLKFALHVLGGTSQAFADWKPEVACREHGNPLPSDDEYISMQDGTMQLKLESFSGLGKTCSLRLTERPSGVPDTVALRLTPNFHIGDTASTTDGITFINAFHKSSGRSRPPKFLNTLNTVTIDSLPPPLPIPFTIKEDENSNRFLVIDMELQYLLPYPALMNAAEMYISLFFVNAQGPFKVRRTGGTFTATVTITSRGRVVVNEDAVPIQIPNGEMYPSPYPLVDGDGAVDPLESIIQRNYPIRSPQIHIQHPETSTILEASQPLRVSIQIPVAPEFDGGDVMYAMLAPAHYSKLSVYSGEFARITPVRKTPLTGYSYRCVAWDQMAAPYVYKNDEKPLTTVNSFGCLPYTQNETPDSTLWKRVELIHPYGTEECFYERAAVCVTPSTTVEGRYDVHPLADCPSFLGSTHAIPCHIMDNDAPQTLPSIINFDADLSSPELDEGNDYIHKKRSITLWWEYRGDPRGALTVAIKPLAQGRDSDDDGQDSQGWIILARDIPAYISPQRGRGSHNQGVTVGFPILAQEVGTVLIRLSLNGNPLVADSTDVVHTIEEAPRGGYQTGCNLNSNKLFDDATHLCRCWDGFTSNIPIGIDNPLVHPSEFTCEPKPPEQVPIDPEQCHTIPKGVEPPYFTLNCGYGFAKNKNGKCDECTCFNAWTKGTNKDDTINDAHKKCERCHLKDVCVVDNTADITFNQAEYCLVERCLCRAGFSGDKCQYAVMYGTLAYHDVATDEQKASLIDATKDNPLIVPRRLITAFHPRVTNNVKASLGDTPVNIFVQQATQVLSDDGEEVITSIMVALGRLTNAEVSPSPSPFTLATGDGSNSNDLGDLHYAWEQLQNNYQDRPVYKDDDYGTLNGGVGSAYDPHCVPNAYTYCPDGKEDDLLPPESQVDEDELKDVYEQEGPDSPIIDNGDDDSSSNTTTYIIIGVVLGVVLILFILLIVAILYCRKHGKMCFRKRKTKGGVSSSKTASHHASSTAGLELTKAVSHSSTPPSAPPSSTMSTSSYLPTQAAVDDPTLPPDWIALRDQNTGKIYYSNKVTMESSWDHPAQPKEKPKSAYGW